MPNTTTLLFPFPTMSDSVAAYPALAQAMAQKVDDHIGILAKGAGSVSLVTVNVPVNVTVTFPTGRFTAAPAVVACPDVAGNPQDAHVSVHTVTATSFVVRAVRTVGTAAIAFYWIAIQQ